LPLGCEAIAVFLGKGLFSDGARDLVLNEHSVQFYRLLLYFGAGGGFSLHATIIIIIIIIIVVVVVVVVTIIIINMNF
jgi:hypothetical protein